jgi:hypothetical protein
MAVARCGSARLLSSNAGFRAALRRLAIIPSRSSAALAERAPRLAPQRIGAEAVVDPIRAVADIQAAGAAITARRDIRLTLHNTCYQKLTNPSHNDFDFFPRPG